MRRRRKPLVLLLAGFNKDLAFRSRMVRPLAKANLAPAVLVLETVQSGLL
jgi:hypothetical protein